MPEETAEERFERIKSKFNGSEPDAAPAQSAPEITDGDFKAAPIPLEETAEDRFARLKAKVNPETIEKPSYEPADKRNDPNEGVEFPAMMRLKSKVFSPSEKGQEVDVKRFLAEKYPGRKLEVTRDPAVTFGTNFIVRNEKGEVVGEFDPQDNSTFKEKLLDLGEVLPAAGVAAGVGAVTGGTGLLAGATVGAGAESWRQIAGGALTDPEKRPDYMNIAISGASEFLPFAGSAAKSGIKDLSKKASGKMAAFYFDKFAVGQSGRRITEESKQALEKYFTPSRLGKINEFMKEEGGNFKKGLTRFRDYIWEPQAKLEKSFEDARVLQRMKFDEAVTQAKAMGPQGQTIVESLQRGGPTKFTAFEGAENLPPPTYFDDTMKEKWYRVDTKLSQSDIDKPVLDPVRAEMNEYIETGKAPIDKLLSMKRRIHQVEFDVVSGQAKKINPAMRKALDETDDLIDSAITARFPEIKPVMKEYSEFKKAIPTKLLDEMETPTFQPSIGSVVATTGTGAGAGLGAGMLGFSAGISAPILAVGIGGASLGSVLLRKASSKPQVMVKLAKYAAEQNQPLAAAFLDDVAKLGMEAAEGTWAGATPEMRQMISSSLPQIFASAVKDSEEIKSAIRIEAEDDRSLSSIEKAKMLSDLNGGKLDISQ